MRNLTIAIVLLALVAVGGVSVLAANRAGRSSCSSSTASASQGSCASTGASAAASCAAPGGKLAGHFDPAMSGVCRFACGTKLKYETKDVLAQPGALPAKLTQCPVSGVVFVVDATRPHVRIAGDDYATCCDRCARKLKQDPRKYLKA